MLKPPIRAAIENTKCFIGEWNGVRSSILVLSHTYNKDGKRKLGECNCKGAQSGYVCYHLAASVAVHIGIASMRRAA